jgi:tRNA threonylcarbamoyladenosine biosynthesis protein TsaE
VDSPTEIVLKSSLAEQTMAYGEALGRAINDSSRPGAVIALSGALGAGKTCFAKGVAKGLGVPDEITSPSYPIICEYEGTKLPFHHIDAYRLKGDEDFAALGGDELIYSGGVSLIEWSEKIEETLPFDAIRVSIETAEHDDRRIRISCFAGVVPGLEALL